MSKPLCVCNELDSVLPVLLNIMIIDPADFKQEMYSKTGLWVQLFFKRRIFNLILSADGESVQSSYYLFSN